MRRKDSRRLVIDASVARSSGEKSATDPRSKQCRDFLQSVLDICHQVVMTRDISDEWKRHQSAFARKWRISMVHKKKVLYANVSRNKELEKVVYERLQKAKEQDAAIKDIHLVLAALESDQSIVSLDEVARNLFKTISEHFPDLKIIAWVNPSNEDEQPIEWLSNGAKLERHRLLRRD